MAYNKIIGYFLLALGIAVIFYGLFSSFSIFTGQKAAPEIFQQEIAQQKTSQTGGSLENQFQQLMQDQLKGIIPTGSLPKILNLMAWSIFAGILVFTGGQIASLGIKLIK